MRAPSTAGAPRRGPPDPRLVEVLKRETADRLFRLGLHRLHRDVADRLGAIAERRLSADPSLRGIVALARQAREEGEPWILRRIVGRVGLAPDSAAGALVCSLLGPLPLLPAERAASGHLVPSSQRLADGRGLLASPREIARVIALVGSVLA